ncbi:L,D-transpeptidase family protein [Hymenobacter sp. 5317J-9]|uniref:L,D-transpeptidase family protein n=1 Tax=Hymenobacter sp. 5317J-9 TaxID=2932250 RepID=UPI001FD656B7|nr:L,D-transpeptidase family protein [Hymenobacter sp. 5317J-9]UOQ96502.1 L,D-transpeptidase family protein [Hymenobacter sp. 5317J-9]
MIPLSALVVMRRCLMLSLAAVLPWCSPAPSETHSSASQPGQSKSTASPPAQDVPVAPLLQALLDTAAAGSARAADACLGLQAGPEVRAFYNPTYEPIWTTADSLTTDAAAAWQQLSRAAELGLPADYLPAALVALRDSLALPADPGRRSWQRARLELQLSDAVLRLMRDLHRGRLRPQAEPAWARGGAKWQPVAALRAALGQGAVPAAMLAGQPTTREYRQLQAALARWLARPVPPDSAAAHRARYQQAALNLERWRWEAWAPTPEYLLVNLPAYELQVVARDSVRRRHRVIIGKPETPTPTLSSAVRYFTLAPDWHVPRSIATKEMLPLLKQDPGYLALNNLALYDQQGRSLDPFAMNWRAVTAQNFPYTIRQSAGCDNALGNVVFRFANPYTVYLHDTPMRQFFAAPARAFSHGCVRLAEPLALAAYLLRREGRPVRLPSEAECARQPTPRDVRLIRPMPIFIRYATCTAENGRLRFFADVYGRDESVRRALFGPDENQAPR